MIEKSGRVLGMVLLPSREQAPAIALQGIVSLKDVSDRPFGGLCPCALGSRLDCRKRGGPRILNKRRSVVVVVCRGQMDYSDVDPGRNPLASVARLLGIGTAFGVPLPLGGGDCGVVMLYSTSHLAPRWVMGHPDHGLS